MKKLICLVSMVLALSCAEKAQETPVLNLADPGKGDVYPDFVLNDIVESVTYLQLEKNDSVFHSSPRISFINDNGDYCLFDMMNNGQVSIYNKEGKLIITFNHTGRGEGEYLDLNSLLYDGDDKIEVLYRDKNVIYQYNRKGEYKSKINIEGATVVRPLENGKYLAVMQVNKEQNILDFVRIVDAEGKVVDRFLPIDTTQNDRSTIPVSSVTKWADGYDFPLHTLKKGTTFYRYDKKENRLTETCRFDLGDYEITEDLLLNGGNPSDHIILIEPHRVGNYLFVQFFNHGGFSVDLWDLSTRKLIARRSAEADSKGKMTYKLPNDKTIGFAWGDFIAHNDQLILLRDPSELEGASETIDPNGNVVVVTIKFKK